MKIALLVIASVFLIAQVPAQDYKVNPETSNAVPNFMGKVMLLKGLAHKTEAGKSYEARLAKGNKVYQGDMIKTGDKTVVKVKMVDDTTVTIGPNSQMEFKKMDFVSKDNRSAIYNILKGKVRANVTRKIKGKNKIIFDSPQASMGIRGTELLANVRMNSLDSSITQFALLSGEGEIKNKVNGKDLIITPKKHFIMASKNSKVTVEDLNEIPDPIYKQLTDKANHIASNYPNLLYYYVLDEEKKEARRLEVERIKMKRQRELESEEQNKKSKGSWRETLKKLNEKLDDNNDY